MDNSIKYMAHEWVLREVKRARQAQARAEVRYRYTRLGNRAGCLECELRNILQKIEILDYLAGLVERDMGAEIGEDTAPTPTQYSFLAKRFENMEV